MYQFRVGTISKTSESGTDWLAAIALCIALLGIATASILIAVASTELTANAITCNRLLIASLVFYIEDLQVADSNLLGDSAALTAAMFSAISILTIEQLRVQFSTAIVVQWTSLAGGLFMLPLTLFGSGQLLPTSNIGWLAIIALGLISQAIGQGLLTYSLAKFSSSFVAVSMLAIPVIAAILALIIFSEQLSLFNWLAFAVVLSGIYLAISAKQSNLEIPNIE